MKKKKGILMFLVVALFISFCRENAFAYIPCMCNNPSDQCTCFIQLGDKGLAVKKIVELLYTKGYLKAITKKNEFTPDVKQAVIKFQVDHNLNSTGWMDDETLDALLLDVFPADDEKHSQEYWDAICFVPTDGGIKYHSDPTCSDMYNPRMISRVNAMSLGIEPCKKNSCKRSSLLTYSSLKLKPRQLPDKYYSTGDRSDFQIEANTLDNMVMERSTSSDFTESVYIGNKNSHVFHLNTCNSVKTMSEKNMIEFQTREEAIEKEYKPCNRCHP